jgi:hypothetical protein
MIPIVGIAGLTTLILDEDLGKNSFDFEREKEQYSDMTTEDILNSNLPDDYQARWVREIALQQSIKNDLLRESIELQRESLELNKATNRLQQEICSPLLTEEK